MFDSGSYAYRDDPFNDAFRGMINAMLRSRVGTGVMFAGLMSLVGIGAWKGFVQELVHRNDVSLRRDILTRTVMVEPPRPYSRTQPLDGDPSQR